MPQLAFPTAYGAGAYTTGGRGLPIYHVTNLNNSGAGSFRQAVTDAGSSGGGNIVFDVSGVIQLSSDLNLVSNLTIAGQTAPEGGITIDGARVGCYSESNIIVRYIRFAGGIDAGDDSVTVRSNILNHIWDHCTFAFGDDEAGSWYEGSGGYNVDKISIQRCFFPENSKGSIIGGGSGTSTITGDISFIYNAFYNTSHRFPNSSGDNANIDIFNNLVWNISSRLIRVNGAGQNLNHENNYYDFGTRGMIDDRLHMYSYETGYPNIYTNGNFIYAQSPSSPLTSTASEMNANNKLAWKHFIDGTNTPQGTRDKGDQLEEEYFTNTRHPILGEAFPILTASEVLSQLPDNVGCNARLNEDGSVSDNKDVLDTDSLNQIKAGNYVAYISKSNYNVVPITSQSRSGYYNSNSHIPETWFLANVPNGEDENDLSPDGFTWFEEFINSVDGDVEVVNRPVITLNGSSTVNLNLNEDYIEAGATAADVEDVNVNVTITGTIDTSTEGTYYIYYNATDSDGNTANQVIRTVIVTDNTQPNPGTGNNNRKGNRKHILRLMIN